MKLVKTLEHQEKFQDFYLDCNKVKRKFVSTFDKGYRLSLEAANLDEVCLKPHFAKFSKHELLSSGAVACLMSGNERNAKKIKLARITKQDIPSVAFDLKRLGNT